MRGLVLWGKDPGTTASKNELDEEQHDSWPSLALQQRLGLCSGTVQARSHVSAGGSSEVQARAPLSSPTLGAPGEAVGA